MKDSDDIDDACPVSPTKRQHLLLRGVDAGKEPENEYAEEEEEPVEAAVPRASLRSPLEAQPRQRPVTQLWTMRR